MPFVGLGFWIWSVGEQAEAKGPVAGPVDATLDALPFIGMAKFGLELITGDLIPDWEDEDPDWIYSAGGDNEQEELPVKEPKPSPPPRPWDPTFFKPRLVIEPTPQGGWRWTFRPSLASEAFNEGKGR